MTEQVVDGAHGSEGGAAEVVGLRGHRVRSVERAQSQREAIIAAAAEVFGEKGYRDARMDEIAERLSVTKPAIYYHFRSKEDLYTEIRVTAMRAGLERLERIIEECGAGGPVAILHETARDLAESAFDPLDRNAILVEPSMPLNERNRQRDQQAGHDYRARLRSVIEQGIAEGVLAQGDATVMTLVFISAAHSIVHWYQPGRRLNREQALAEVVERVMGVVLPTAR